ncbi:12082_t:CDS:10, partial [Funneliformis mosseae]
MAVFTQTNNTHFVLDTSQLWQVVDIHEQFQDITVNSQAGYYHIKQSCDSCGETKIINKKWNILTAGLSIKILIKCQVCKTVKEFSNESAEVNFNACFAAADLVGRINRQSLQMTFIYADVISQLCKASYYNYQAMTFEKIMKSAKISTKIALQKASGEIIYDGKDDGEDKIIREGNFDLNSHQMEHAILISILGKLTPILEEHNMLINVTIDSDLDSNKTLGNVAVVNQIFANFNYVYAASIQKSEKENCSIQEKDICNVQTEVCWIKNNPELQLSEPTLKFYTLYQREKFKSILKTIFRLPINQDIELIPYGKKAQCNIDTNQFYPSFALQIPDFDEIIKCVTCHAFPKCTAKALIDDQVMESIKAGISCGSLYTSIEQPLQYQKNVFEEIACRLTKIIFTTPKKFQMNTGFRSILQRYDTTNGIRFVEITTRLEIDYQQTSLIRNIAFEDNQIIYKSYENITTELQSKISKETIAIYHDELSAKQKSAILLDWRSRKFQIMVVTNTFEMGINIPDVRIVIHVGFLMSISNLVQESEHAGRDGLSVKPGDSTSNISNECNVYVEKMLEIIEIITNERQQITRNNVVDVFHQSQAKNIKNKFGELPIYLEKFLRKLKTKEDAFLLLDDLVLHDLVKEDIILTRSLTAQTFT